jgi:alkanesulfonate monooxygenase SsuD/methylene tetrahydromethanopterin reductase-like flavin-dependent oxidoreductase (luciferase family)
VDVGVGLWTLRSTSERPASFPALYADLQDDARLAERLGFHSLWLSEHHFWYDGWCAAPLVAGAAVLAATARLALGTGVMLLPLHDPHRLASTGRTLAQLAPGRTELGVGLGYRDVEFDGLGVSRRRRGRLADAALDILVPAWEPDGPRLWVGGLAGAALERGAARGLGLFLPSSMRRDQLRRVIDEGRRAAAAAGTRLGRIGMLKLAWVTDGSSEAAARARERLALQAREYSGSWWRVQGRLGFEAEDLLDQQMARNADTAIVGPPEALAEELSELERLGVDLVVLHIAAHDMRPGYRAAMEQVSSDVLPLLA